MKLWCLTDNSFICFGSNTEALRYYYPINSGQFSQVRAFTPNNHEFCFVNILKTKNKGTHTFPSFVIFPYLGRVAKHANLVAQKQQGSDRLMMSGEAFDG